MSMMKRAVLLLLLVTVGSNADPEPEPTTDGVAPTKDPCHGLKHTIHPKDLHQFNGEWVLFWSVADHEDGHDMLSNLSSSHVEIHADNKTFSMIERNLYIDEPKRRDYIINQELDHDADDHSNHNIHVASIKLEANGEPKDHSETADIVFYETVPEGMLMVYKWKNYRFLLSYRQYGKHQDAKKVETVHDDHKQQAKCLNFPDEKPYSYDGKTDFAHKKADPEHPPTPDAPAS